MYKHVLDPAPAQGSNPHKHLMEWVWNYYSEGSRSSNHAATKVVCTGKPPLYFQHDGHSRTIVGIEETPKGFSLLVLDPGISGEKLEDSLRCNVKMVSKYPGGLVQGNCHILEES